MSTKQLEWLQVAILGGGLVVAGVLVYLVMPWVDAAPPDELRAALVIVFDSLVENR